jgi:hypothetical protein
VSTGRFMLTYGVGCAGVAVLLVILMVVFG